ncbi:MAG: GNAT family N-acetyltransferase [Rectinema sp.]
MSIDIMYDVLPKIAASGLERIMPDSLDNAINLSAAAFISDPLYVATAPDAEEREKLARSLTELFIRYGMRFGIAYKTGGTFDGLAVWLPPKERGIPWVKAVRIGALHLLFRTKLKDLRRLMAVDKIARRAHINNAPGLHWYLLELAVTPDKQGRGIASKLIKPFLDMLDEAGEAAYLETHNPNNVGIYRHYGFELLGDYEVPHLPDLHHFSMFRPPYIYNP